ncbi:MAG: hypothetical protein ACKOUS_22970 [Alphaproteobacteria bacterium]
MKPPGLVVRRSRAISAMNAAMAVCVLAAAVGFLFHRPDGEAVPWLGGAAIIALIGFHAVQSVRNLMDTTPLLTVGPEGLGLPQATDAPIPWTQVTGLGASRSMTLFGGGRLDIELVPEAFARVRLGRRLFGDAVVKTIGPTFSISFHAQGLDHKATEILAATAAYWPPRDIDAPAGGG